MKFKILVLMFPLVMTSCSVSKEHSIYTINNFEIKENKETEYQWINLSANEVAAMIDTNQTFPLVIYSKSCSYCEKFESVLKKYNSGNQRLFYRYESNTSSNTFLKETYPEIFKSGFTTPSLLLIKNGELTYEYNNSKLLSYNAFKPVCNQHLIKTNVNILFTETSLELYRENKTFLCYVYSSENEDSMALLSSNILSSAFESNKDTLIIDNETSNIIDIDEYSLDYDYSCFLFEEGQIKSATNSTEDSTILLSMISTYYN